MANAALAICSSSVNTDHIMGKDRRLLTRVRTPSRLPPLTNCFPEYIGFFWTGAPLTSSIDAYALPLNRDRVNATLQWLMQSHPAYASLSFEECFPTKELSFDNKSWFIGLTRAYFEFRPCFVTLLANNTPGASKLFLYLTSNSCQKSIYVTWGCTYGFVSRSSTVVMV